MTGNWEICQHIRIGNNISHLLPSSTEKTAFCTFDDLLSSINTRHPKLINFNSTYNASLIVFLSTSRQRNETYTAHMFYQIMDNTKILSTKPHFFKPLLPGFHQEFLIPVAFLKYLNGKNHVEAVLRSTKGKAWPVKINGRRIEYGWEEFAMEHDLHVGDFLVVGHAGHMVFDVIVFDSSGCERAYPHFNVKEEKASSEEEEPETKVSSREFTRKKHAMPSSERKTAPLAIRNPCFEVTVKPYHFKENRMLIPRSFARSNGLDNRISKITLMNQQGRSWSANLRKGSCGQVYIGDCWTEFRIQNKLRKGDSFFLEFIDSWRNPKFVFHRI